MDTINTESTYIPELLVDTSFIRLPQYPMSIEEAFRIMEETSNINSSIIYTGTATVIAGSTLQDRLKYDSAAVFKEMLRI